MKYHDSRTGADVEIRDGIMFIYGSSEKKDWKQDFKFWLKRHDGVIAHAGAMEQAIWIKGNCPMEGVKFIYGHSLGGAVAIILGEFYPGIPICPLAPFAPFPFWYKIKNKKVTSYVGSKDIVPRVFFWRRGKGEVMHFKSNSCKNAHIEYDKYTPWHIRGLK